MKSLKEVTGQIVSREFCQLVMFAIWYLPRFGNLFIQSAAKCTCTNFIFYFFLLNQHDRYMFILLITAAVNAPSLRFEKMVS
jgi:hypothetical protein